MTTGVASTLRTAARRVGTNRLALGAAGRPASFAEGPECAAHGGSGASLVHETGGHRPRVARSAAKPKLGRAPGALTGGARRAAALRRITRTVARLFQANAVTYDEARGIFKAARARAGLARPRRAGRLPDALSRAEVDALIAAAYAASPRDGLLVEVLFYAGVRVAECAALKVGHLRLDEGALRVEVGKGGKGRLVPLPRALAEKLRLHVGARADGPVFESRQQGRALTARRIEQVVAACARRAGLKRRVTPHTLRRSLGTFLLNAGLTLDAVADILGHADVKVTRAHYARLAMPEVRRRYAQAVGDEPSPEGRP